MKYRASMRLLLIAIVLGAAAFGVWVILDTDPAPRKQSQPPLAPLVRVLSTTPADHAIRIDAHGSVSAAEQLAVRPQVGGQLLELHPAFEPGGVIPAGEQLFQIDPTDYRLQVQTAEAAIAKARAELDIEQGRRKVAAEELRLLEGSVKIDRSSRALALRAPQLKQVRAELMRAENELEKASTELSRTRAEFAHDVVVLEREKVTGEIVAARDIIGVVARADRFWVELQVPPSLLARLRARKDDGAGAKVSIYSQGHEYPAEVTRIRAELSGNSRLAGVLAEVNDPLGKHSANQGRPPLLIGAYVEAQVDAGMLQNVLAVPRNALQDNNRLWVVDADRRLQVHQVEPVFIGEETVYIPPLEAGEHVLLGNPSGLVPGSEVRVQEAP